MSNSDENIPTKPKPAAPAPVASREWDPFAGLHTDLDQMVNALRGGFWRSPLGLGVPDLSPVLRGKGIAPAVDISETESSYELTAELPGLAPEHVEVKMANGRLTIKGEKQEESEEKKEGYHLSERRYGSFQRTFSLPEGIDEEKITAEFKNGVLKITLPKAPDLQQQEKKIEIQSR